MNTLDSRLQKLVDLGEPGIDILHGELKNLMYEIEQDINNISESQDAPIFNYLNGVLDAYATVYKLTYDLAFAIGERNAN